MQESADNSPAMQVLICTFGKEGIERIAGAEYPQVAGVRYLVSWQHSQDFELPDALRREDFDIVRTESVGLSKNRNHAFSNSSAPILLISDDDVAYMEQNLKDVIKAFEDNPQADILTFRYDSIEAKKTYPDHEFDLTAPPKGYFVTSFEIAIRSKNIKGRIWMNESFGIGATFPAGEEDIFIRDCLDAGLKGKFLPITVARHDEPTTSEKNLMLPSRPATKGAVFLRLHPRSWVLRMAAHALREIPLWRKGLVPSPLSYCINWMRGAIKARRLKVFPTPDYTDTYASNHEPG